MPRTELQEWPLGAIQWILARNRWCSKTSVPMFRLSARGGLLLDGSHPSVITSKAANGYHFKTGQLKWPSRTEIVLASVSETLLSRIDFKSAQKLFLVPNRGTLTQLTVRERRVGW
jgi:hypothetical protein